MAHHEGSPSAMAELLTRLRKTSITALSVNRPDLICTGHIDLLTVGLHLRDQRCLSTPELS